MSFASSEGTGRRGTRALAVGPDGGTTEGGGRSLGDRQTAGVPGVPFAFFEERLPMRYSYFGHAGLAICAAALVRAGWRATARWRLPEALDISPSRAAPEMPASATSGGPLPVDAPAQAAR